MASSEWTATEGPVRYICAECGSDDVQGDARAVWDEQEQSWGVIGQPEHMNCTTCGTEDVAVHAIQIAEERLTFKSTRTEGAA